MNYGSLQREREQELEVNSPKKEKVHYTFLTASKKTIKNSLAKNYK